MSQFEYLAAKAKLVANIAGTGYADPAAGLAVHYLITAVDFAGNESPAASPLSISGVDDGETQTPSFSDRRQMVLVR